MATTEEEYSHLQPPAPPPMADVAAATQLPGVSPRSISPAAEANKDMDHMRHVGGNPEAADQQIADALARGGAAGLTSGQKSVDVAQASQQSAAGARIDAANAQPIAGAQQIAASDAGNKPLSLDALKDMVGGAIEKLGELKQAISASTKDIPEVKLAELPTPAAVVSQPVVKEQSGAAIG